jgi:hypothetical protein
MSVTPIDDRMLELFVSKKYHWNSLSPEEQQSMAVELMKSRLIINKMNSFIYESINDKDIQRKYRNLICEL